VRTLGTCESIQPRYLTLYRKLRPLPPSTSDSLFNQWKKLIFDPALFGKSAGPTSRIFKISRILCVDSCHEAFILAGAWGVMTRLLH